MNPDSRTMTFETPGPARLRISVPSGRISVIAEDTAVTRVLPIGALRIAAALLYLGLGIWGIATTAGWVR